MSVRILHLEREKRGKVSLTSGRKKERKRQNDWLDDDIAEGEEAVVLQPTVVAILRDSILKVPHFIREN